MIARGIACMIDSYVGALLASLPISMITLSSLHTMTQNVFLLEKGQAILAICCGFMLLIGYYIFIPVTIFKGQTLGKRLVNLKVVYQSKRSLIIRQGIVMMLFSTGGKLVAQLISVLLGSNMITIMMDITMYLSIVSLGMYLTTRGRLTLQDLLTNTTLSKIETTVQQSRRKGDIYGSIHG